MTFYSIAVTVLIVCYRRGDVKARPQDEENAYAFARQPPSLHARSHADEGNSYVDSKNQEYRQPTNAIANANAATTTSPTPASAFAKSSIKAAAAANYWPASSENAADAAKMEKTLASERSSAAEAATSASLNLNRLEGISAAASSFNGFATGGNSVFSSPSLPLPPAPAPPSFSFPPDRLAFAQFGSSSSPFANGGSGYDSGGGGGGHSGTSAGSEAAYHNVEPIIHKSVYVHVAPQEDHVPKQKVILPKMAPKKNYQIVFIKAPTPPPPSAPVIPPFPPQSDKTLIYVLHPKPEEAPPIHIPAPPQNAPVKPEVYFIKYKTKKEQEEDENYSGGGGGGGDGDGYHHHHHRRQYGRDGLEEETEADDESLEFTDTAAATRSASAASTLQELDGTAAMPSDGDGSGTAGSSNTQYEEQNGDASGESSNIVRIYTARRGGKNAH